VFLSKIQPKTRRALNRLFILFLCLGLVAFGCWGWMIRMPGKSFRGSLPPLTPAQAALRDELEQHVTKLAGEIGERNVFNLPRLNAAADYVESSLASAGYKVSRQSYLAGGETCQNLEVEIRGTTRPEEIVVVGAHYDSVAGSPGANDNASGVATVLALARMASVRQPERTLRFVAFVNEEPPFFSTTNQGSYVYAQRCRERGERIMAMLTPETMGCYLDERGTQQYPFPVGLFYPSRGNFIAFVGNTKSAALVRRCVKTFRARAAFPSEGAALPGVLPGIGWSDHSSFWKMGYPAIQISDTAPFRYVHYHQETDTPDKLDYDRLARVVDGLEKVIAELAGAH
jgi:hypothetical protein